MDMLFAAFVESSDLSGTKTLAHCSRAATGGRHSSDGSIGEGEMRKLPHQRWPGKHAASDELLKNEVIEQPFPKNTTVSFTDKQLRHKTKDTPSNQWCHSAKRQAPR